MLFFKWSNSCRSTGFWDEWEPNLKHFKTSCINVIWKKWRIIAITFLTSDLFFRDTKEQLKIETAQMKKLVTEKKLKLLERQQDQSDELHRMKCETERLQQQLIRRKIAHFDRLEVWLFLYYFCSSLIFVRSFVSNMTNSRWFLIVLSSIKIKIPQEKQASPLMCKEK